jgi:hypothetical protein
MPVTISQNNKEYEDEKNEMVDARAGCDADADSLQQR